MLQPHSLIRAAAALAVAGLLSGAGVAPAAAAPPPRDRAATIIDPAAVEALTRMGEYLSTLKSFELTAETTVEAVLRGGHQVEIGGTVHYFVRLPDRVRIDSDTDTVRRQYFYDGKTFTIVAPDQRYYAQAAGKPSVRETLAFAAQTLNVELPLADIFEWASPQTPLKQFRRGFFVGTAKVGGQDTEHYALISRDLDLELWIKPGDTPLPLKMSLVDRRVEGSPRFTARLTWQTNPSFGDDVFTFTPGSGVARIEFAKPAGAGKGGK